MNQLDLFENAGPDEAVYCPRIGKHLQRLARAGVLVIEPAGPTVSPDPSLDFKIIVTEKGREILRRFRLLKRNRNSFNHKPKE